MFGDVCPDLAQTSARTGKDADPKAWQSHVERSRTPPGAARASQSGRTLPDIGPLTMALSRRRLLASAGIGAAGVGLGAGGYLIGHDAAEADAAESMGTVPFHGEHQAGISTPVQDRLHFASFDLETESKAELRELLEEWTRATVEMTEGKMIGNYAGNHDVLLIAVRPRHARFYQRFLGFDAIAEERSHARVCGTRGVALAADLNRLAINHPRVHEWMFGEPFSHAALAYKPLSAELLDEMKVIVEVCCGAPSSRERALQMALECLSGELV